MGSALKADFTGRL